VTAVATFLPTTEVVRQRHIFGIKGRVLIRAAGQQGVPGIQNLNNGCWRERRQLPFDQEVFSLLKVLQLSAAGQKLRSSER